MINYFIMGACIYAWCAVNNLDSFKNATKTDIALGVLGAVFWPITIYIVFTREKE